MPEVWKQAGSGQGVHVAAEADDCMPYLRHQVRNRKPESQKEEATMCGVEDPILATLMREVQEYERQLEVLRYEQRMLEARLWRARKVAEARRASLEEGNHGAVA